MELEDLLNFQLEVIQFDRKYNLNLEYTRFRSSYRLLCNQECKAKEAAKKVFHSILELLRREHKVSKVLPTHL